jgi:hypothetical protein
MGLDMYLEKAKRVDGITVKKLVEINNYFDYINRGHKYEDVKMSEWCGFEISDETVPFVKQYEDEYITRYASWDEEKACGYKAIIDNVGYWRKANQIHNWFVKNVQKGVDDCGTYYVSTEKLQKLVETCKEVLDNHELAEELLPTCSGFFFGDTKYDEYYFADLQDTINMLSDIDEECEYIYHASW